MKFKTFRCLVAVAVLVGVVGLWKVSSGGGNSQTVPAPVSVPTVVVTHAPLPPPPPLVAAPVVQVEVRSAPVQVAPAPVKVVVQVAPAVVSAPVQTQVSRTATTEELKSKLGSWLSANKYRHGKKTWEDFLPGESFRATVVRFPEADAVKWSNNQGHWSQIKIDLNRDGKDDEKWLLKNSELYKREVLNSSGQVTQTEYFKN
jgi:hypothetical protein